MSKYLLGLILLVIIGSIGINAYWTNRLIKFAEQSEMYFKYLEIQTACTEAAVITHDQQIVKLSNNNLKPFGNILHVYLSYIPDCRKLAEYRCWQAENEEALNKCHEEAIKQGRRK